MYYILIFPKTKNKPKLEKGNIKMGRKLLEVTTFHGFTINELIALEESYYKKSLKALL